MSGDLRSALLAVRAEHGRLTPDAVVTAARPADHPLHSRFEWDDAVAGEEFRRVQARELIRSVRVVYREATEKDPARSVRAFHAVRDDEGERDYAPLDDVVASPFLTKLVLADMRREWLALRRRYESFDEFWRLVAGEADEATG